MNSWLTLFEILMKRGKTNHGQIFYCRRHCKKDIIYHPHHPQLFEGWAAYGRKIGGQWRFTQEDFTRFIDQSNVVTAIASENKQAVLDFVDGVYADYTGPMQICTIVDVYSPAESLIALRDALMAITPAESDFMKFFYEYEEAEGRGRFTLFGAPGYIGAAMEILAKQTNNSRALTR